MSEFGGLWKHENNQHALVPAKTECGCPCGGGIENGHIRYIWRNAEENNNNNNNNFEQVLTPKSFISEGKESVGKV